MSDANAGGQANDAMIQVEENGVEMTLRPQADPEVWMLCGSLASALEDALDAMDTGVFGNLDYAHKVLESYQAMKVQQTPLRGPSEAPGAE